MYRIGVELSIRRSLYSLELAGAGERDDALEGLARYCTGEASLAAEGLVGPAQSEWLDRVRDDLGNLIGASREIVSLTLSEFRRRGAVSMLGRRIVIEPDKLRFEAIAKDS